MVICHILNQPMLYSPLNRFGVSVNENIIPKIGRVEPFKVSIFYFPEAIFHFHNSHLIATPDHLRSLSPSPLPSPPHSAVHAYPLH